MLEAQAAASSAALSRARAREDTRGRLGWRARWGYVVLRGAVVAARREDLLLEGKICCFTFSRETSAFPTTHRIGSLFCAAPASFSVAETQHPHLLKSEERKMRAVFGPHSARFLSAPRLPCGGRPVMYTIRATSGRSVGHVHDSSMPMRCSHLLPKRTHVKSRYGVFGKCLGMLGTCFP